MKGHEAVARALMDLGTDPLFGLIGDGNLYMVDSYVRDCGGRYIRATHEAGAALMALGHAQVSGRVGVATVTHGPALTNTLTVLVEGVKSSVPMVLVAGDTAVEDRGHFQNVNQREFIAAAGAGFEQLRAPHTIAEDMARVFRRAVHERRPIVLNMPIEFQWLETDYNKPRPYLPEMRCATTAGADMDNAIGIIASCHQPIVVAGRGAMSADAEQAIARFAERIEAPVATTLKGRGLFLHDPFNLGICGTLSDEIALDVIGKSDCLIVFGASLNKHTANHGSLTRDKWIIHVNASATGIDRFTPVEAGLIGDPGLVADAMVELLDMAEIPGSGTRTEELRTRLANKTRRPRLPGTPRAGAVDLFETLHALDDTLPRDRVFVTDGGRFAIGCWTEINVDRPQDFIPPVGFGSIGVGLGEAIGAAVAAAGRTTLHITGDGGFMLAGLSELTSAVREQLDLVIVVCNDGSYGAEHIQFTAKDMDPGLSLLEWPDFAPVARALGANAMTVTSSDDLQAAMTALADRDRSVPFLLDVKLDPEVMPEL